VINGIVYYNCISTKQKFKNFLNLLTVIDQLAVFCYGIVDQLEAVITN